MSLNQVSPKLQRFIDGHLLLTLGLSIFAVAPLLHPGYFQTHTGFVPLWSIADLKQHLVNVNWLPALAGFDPWRSGGLLPYYLAALLPLSPLAALKLVSILGILAGSSGLYLWLKSWVGPHGATVAALAYTYAPFTLAGLYVRGAWSEAFFWGVLPWALLAATFLVARPRLPFMLIAVAFWAGLGLSQLGLSVWAYLFLVVMLLVFHRPQARPPLIAAALGLIAAALITLPRGAVSGSTMVAVNLTEHLLYPSQLLSPFWGYGLSQPGWADGLSLSLGLAAPGLTLLTFTVWRGGPDRRPWFFVGLTAFVALAIMPIGGWLWPLPGLNRLLTYPWQLLGFAALGLAVMAGISFWLNQELHRLPIFGAVITVVLLAMYPNLEPQFITTPIPDAPEAAYGNNQILLLGHKFVVENPTESTDLHPVEPYLPLAQGDPLTPGDTFYLQVRWQAVAQPEQSYKVFAHLVDANGQIITQVDVFPQNGERSTTTWLPGEIIADMYTFTLPRNSPSPAQVWLGLYNAETLTRLPVSDDDQGRAKLDVR